MLAIRKAYMSLLLMILSPKYADTLLPKPLTA